MNNRMPKANKGGAPAGMPHGEMPAIKLSTIKRLFSYIFKYKVQFAIVLVCIVANSLVTVQMSLFIQSIIDDYITPMLETVAGGGEVDFSPLISKILSMAAIFLVGIVAQYLNSRLMVVVTQGTQRDIRDDMFRHMQTLPIKYFDTHVHGDIMSYYTNDTDTLRQFVSQSITGIISAVITAVSVFVAMISLSWQMTLVVMLTVVLMVTVTKNVAGKSAKFFVKQQKSIADVNGYIEEMIHGQRVIKVFCHEEAAKEEFDRRNDELCDNSTKANSFVNILGPINGNLGHLQYVLIAIAGGMMAILFKDSSGAPLLTLGTIASFLNFSKSFTNPINQIMQQMNSIVMAFAGAERIFSLLDAEPEQDNGYVTLVNAEYDENGQLTETDRRTHLWAWKHPHEDGTTTYTELKGDVRLVDVDFGYSEDKLVLHDISVYAKPGQKVALVGSTGAGKTTITNLINRFYDIADGKVRYDGININKIKKTDLRRSLGVVLQDVNLFTGTVRDNIRYGRLDATDEEVEEAAKLANAHDFIVRLPQGYDTMIDGDGGSLSQGQRQLISIARAAIADPPVMILDEATSSIDTRTEALVQRGMDALMKGRTVFVIAHRLSTIQNSDVIMVMEDGRIIERGSHDDLIAEKGRYYQLYTGALELE